MTTKQKWHEKATVQAALVNAIPAFLAAVVGIVAIIITVNIANKQSEKDFLIFRMQTQQERNLNLKIFKMQSQRDSINNFQQSQLSERQLYLLRQQIIQDSLNQLLSINFGLFLENLKNENETNKQIRREVYKIITQDLSKIAKKPNDSTLYNNSKIKEILFENAVVVNFRKDKKMQNSINVAVSAFFRSFLHSYLISKSEIKTYYPIHFYLIKQKQNKYCENLLKYLVNQLNIIGIEYIKQPEELFMNEDELPLINPIRGEIDSCNVIVPHRWGSLSSNTVIIKAKKGTPVIATITGNVERSKYERSLGNVIIIKNDLGFLVQYNHLNKRTVFENQKVFAGDIIGEAGNTGRMVTSGLEYSIQINENKIRPNNFLSIDYKIKYINFKDY